MGIAAAFVVLLGSGCAGTDSDSEWVCDSCGSAPGIASSAGEPADADGDADDIGDEGDSDGGDDGNSPGAADDGQGEPNAPMSCEETYSDCMEREGDADACGQQLEACQTPSSGDDSSTPSDEHCEETSETASGVAACSDGIDNDCDGAIDCADDECDWVCDSQSDGLHCEEMSVPDCFGCSCVPGSVRDCHVPGPCTWGQATCTEHQTWGPCTETNDIPEECTGFLGLDGDYDTACCVAAGRCCENLDYDYDLYDPTQGAHASVGNCDAICIPDSNPQG